jgi:hypothetical protein
MRVRPKVMTVATMLLGLIPLLWATGSGADVMKRIAAPMVGGLLTSAFLTLELIPVVYTYWRREQLVMSQQPSLSIPALLLEVGMATALGAGFLLPVFDFLGWPSWPLHGILLLSGIVSLAGATSYLVKRRTTA